MNMPDDPLDELSPDEERELEMAIVCAYRPGAINPELNRFLIEQAILDPLAPATEDERVESERLRDALAGKHPHPDLPLVDALRSAGGADRPAPALDSSHARNKVIWVRFGAAVGVLAAAAALALLLSRPFAQRLTRRSGTAWAVSRSTSTLFDHKFDIGGTTARLDRIASVRLKEMRANRYRGWAVP